MCSFHYQIERTELMHGEQIYLFRCTLMPAEVLDLKRIAIHHKREVNLLFYKRASCRDFTNHAQIWNDCRSRFKTANYAVLRETNMPAVLTENLFIDTTADGEKLKTRRFFVKWEKHTRVELLRI